MDNSLLVVCDTFPLEKRVGAAKRAIFTITFLSSNGGGDTYTVREESITVWNKIEHSGTESLLTNGGGATYSVSRDRITDRADS